jgi:hypothetical protein
MYYCNVVWSAGVLPIELWRFLPSLAIERQIDARLHADYCVASAP